jgi:NAD(P)-dependent dehydrogenase (short-subunit alcohol dehydrogenase family)
MLDSFSLAGRTVVVTGASGDIGRAIALTVADHGADVALLARSVDRLEAVAAEVTAKGRRAAAVPCDVTSSEAIAEAAEMVAADLGDVDVLINNAGGARFIAPPLDVVESGWSKTIALNLTGPFLLSQAFGRQMVERGRGSIINVGSLSGLRHLPGMAAYTAAKAGLYGETRALAREWGPHNVRVNAVAPGFIDTSAWENFDKDEVVAEAGIPIPMGRWATADEVALPVAFLASDAASYITGITMVIDGGMLT